MNLSIHSCLKPVPGVSAWVVALLVMGWAAALHAAPPDPPTFENATSHHNVRYLPDWRYGDDPAPHRDHQMVMDIHVPNDGLDRHPVIFIVHGGGWRGGTKEENLYTRLMGPLLKHGYVVVGYNYIMKPRGIFPQVYWDYRDAARFLRMHAEKYKIDPAAFGAIGISAGGWLISGAGHGTGDLLSITHENSWHVLDLQQRRWRPTSSDFESTFPRPMQSPQPAYPEEYGLFQAISMDFHSHMKNASGNTPAFNDWIGEGYKGKARDREGAERGAFDYTQTIFPAHKNKGVHAPPLFGEGTPTKDHPAAVYSPDGKSLMFGMERIIAFFDEELKDNPRTPLPEIRPATRVIQEPVTVELVMPQIDHQIHYQVIAIPGDNKKKWHELTPNVDEATWRAWPVYKDPFEVAPGSIVRAVGTSPGRRPSTIAQAFFVNDRPPARIIAPEVRQLPPGRTGEPYEVTFKSDAKNPRFLLRGDLLPYQRWGKADFQFPQNMVFNTETGRWHGTPIKPGRYWIQVWVNDHAGRVATHRDYVWEVEGENLAKGDEPAIELEDIYQQLCYVKFERGKLMHVLARDLTQAGIRVEVEPDDDGAMLLVDKRRLAEARTIIEPTIKQWKLEADTEWFIQE